MDLHGSRTVGPGQPGQLHPELPQDNIPPTFHFLSGCISVPICGARDPAEGRARGRRRCAPGEDDGETTLLPMKRATALGKVEWRPANEGLRTIMMLRPPEDVMTLASNIGVYLTTFPAL